jgi:hypothetical protein
MRERCKVLFKLILIYVFVEIAQSKTQVEDAYLYALYDENVVNFDEYLFDIDGHITNNNYAPQLACIDFLHSRDVEH